MMTTHERSESERKYSVLVRWSDIDNSYLAEISEFPGVSGYGATRDAAVKQVEDALELALEAHAERNWEPPKPDASLGASGQFRLRLPRQLHARLSSAATQNGVSLNQFVVSLISDSFARTQQVPKDAIAELKAWFEVTLEARVREAAYEALRMNAMYGAPQAEMPPEPFPVMEGEPIGGQYIPIVKFKFGQNMVQKISETMHVLDPNQLMKK
jgi:antitoxin HicB